MRFCKENYVIDQGEGTGTIIDTEPDNEIKYREEIDNAQGKAFINELTKLINEWYSKSPNRDICLKALMVMPSLRLPRTLY